jgi:hypothetical protein
MPRSAPLALALALTGAACDTPTVRAALISMVKDARSQLG